MATDHDTGRVLRRVFLLFGLIFGALGLALVAWYMASDSSARVRAIPQRSAAALADASPGQEVLVEGRVSTQNPVAPAGLVVYERSEMRSDQGDTDWWVVERTAPLVQVELTDGAVVIASAEAALVHPARSQEEPGGRRIEGFAVGDPVVAIGRTVGGRGEAALAARLLVGGTREGYLARLRGGDSALLWIAGGMLIFAGIFGGIGLLLGRRAPRRG